jgi:hypothetical protein
MTCGELQLPHVSLVQRLWHSYVRVRAHLCSGSGRALAGHLAVGAGLRPSVYSREPTCGIRNDL